MDATLGNTALQLQVTVENLSPENGATIAQVWFGFHDGNFDTFNVGEAASDGLEILAEDGLIGLEEILVPGTLAAAIGSGLDVSALPIAAQQAIALGLDLSQIPPPPGTLAGDFLLSPSGSNGGTQGVIATRNNDPSVFDILDDPDSLSQELLDSINNPFFFTRAPGEIDTAIVTLNGTPEENQFFSFASMIFPTNDGFIGNDDPLEIQIFDDAGNFIGADFILTGDQVWDAGTEVNDEAFDSLLYTFEAFGQGQDQNGTVQQFPGFLPAGAGGILDFEFNGRPITSNADFTASNAPLARITVSLVEAPTVDPPIPPFIDVLPLTGTEENDQLAGLGGRFLGLGGDDQIFNNGGDSEQFGGEGNDNLFGSSGQDLLDGGLGDDRLYGNGGLNIFLGGEGNDEIYGSEGLDVAFAGAGDDLLYGNGGRDLLIGDAGNDRILAGEGDDVLGGGAGEDMLFGGGGSDLFVYGLGDGVDTIEDFRVGEDGIGLIQGELAFADLSLMQDGLDTVLGVVSTGETLAILKFTQASLLGESSFQVVPRISTPEQALALL